LVPSDIPAIRRRIEMTNTTKDALGPLGLRTGWRLMTSVCAIDECPVRASQHRASLNVGNGPEAPVGLISAKVCKVRIVLKNSYFGADRPTFSPQRPTSWFWRGGRPNPHSCAARPSPYLWFAIQSDFLRTCGFGGKSRLSDFGVF